MKIKTFVAHRAPILEQQFDEWWKPDILVSGMELGVDKTGNPMLVVLYDDEVRINDEGIPEPVQNEIVEPEQPQEQEQGCETADVESTSDQEDVVIDMDAPMPEELCPHCNTLTRPTVVLRGPYAGRHKCTQCEKTYDVGGDS